jgi:hypothetical protein
MVRMTCLGQFVIDCNDRDSIFELGCALFLEGAKGGELCRILPLPRPNSFEYFLCLN